MALYRVSNSSDLLIALSRVSQTATTLLGEIQCTQYTARHQNRMKNLHVTSVRRYPDPPALPLPTNVSEIFANEIGRFTPERARDIATPVLLYGNSDCRSFHKTEQLTKSTEQSTKLTDLLSSLENCDDTHVDSYDCFGAVSLNGTMQSNVPKPFCSNGKSMHLNMPGGQWAKDGKYIAEDMQKSHYRSVCLPSLKMDKSGLTGHVATNVLFLTMYKPKYIYGMGFATKVPPPLNNVSNTKDKNINLEDFYSLSKKERFKIMLKDYGIVVSVFHIGISLISLGACYAAVNSGIDLTGAIHSIYEIDNKELENIINNSSTFLIAYSIHKLMAPVRITITLGVTPLLVKRLRKYGILKFPKKDKPSAKASNVE